MNVGALPLLLLPYRLTLKAASLWARLVLFGLKALAGIGIEVRGRLEDPRVLIAAKHLSMWETVALLALLPGPAIVLKRSLLRIPFYGWYCGKMRMIAIDRAAVAKAIRLMHGEAKRALDEGRPIVIFPEGTRRKPGDPPDYKPGVAGLYAQLDVPCVPVAHNSGLFWAGGFFRKPGTIILEFLPPIPPGLPRRDFMGLLESRIEEARNRLLTEGRRGTGSRKGPNGL